MPDNLSFGVKLIAVVVLIRLLTDLVPVRRGTFLLDEDAPDTGGVADKKHRAVIQIEPDTGNIETPDFILEVFGSIWNYPDKRYRHCSRKS